MYVAVLVVRFKYREVEAVAPFICMVWVSFQVVGERRMEMGDGKWEMGCRREV